MRIVALLVTLALPPIAQAELVDINWSGGTFSHKASIAPKKFLEVCGKLKMADVVAWQFKGSAPTDFNIHYHVGKDVSYPEKRKDVATADGSFAVPLDQDYCWMWSNQTSQAIDIDVSLKQAKPGK